MNPVRIAQGSSPIILGLPHTGTFIPENILANLNQTGRAIADTDWHIDRLYADLLDNVTMVEATYSRYVIDANRDPEGVSLYPGQNTTTLCPLTDFDGKPIYLEGREPATAEIEARREKFHAPYHAALRQEIERVKAIHGIAVLYDCHSIRSRIPYLFDGELPIFNVGTNLGATCDAVFENLASTAIQSNAEFPFVMNGRFKGGWTTRHYGRPEIGEHAIQMEIAQRAYMTESPPWSWSEDRATQIRPILKSLLQNMERAALKLAAENEK